MKAALTTIEKNHKLNKEYKIEPTPKYIRNIIISRRLRYLKAHPKKKRKLEAKINIEEFNKQIMKHDQEIKDKDYMNIDIPDEIDIDINKDAIFLEQVKQLNKLSEEETKLQKTIYY